MQFDGGESVLSMVMDADNTGAVRLFPGCSSIFIGFKAPGAIPSQWVLVASQPMRLSCWRPALCRRPDLCHFLQNLQNSHGDWEPSEPKAELHEAIGRLKLATARRHSGTVASKQLPVYRFQLCLSRFHPTKKEAQPSTKGSQRLMDSSIELHATP